MKALTIQMSLSNVTKLSAMMALMIGVSMSYPAIAQDAPELEPPVVDVQELLADTNEADAQPTADMIADEAMEKTEEAVVEDVIEIISESESEPPFPTGEALTPPSDAQSGPGAQEALSNLPDPAETEAIEEDVFFDAQSLVPTGEMGRKSGPTKVNPRLQPASKLVVVKKNYTSGSKPAQLVAAERATKLGRYDSALEIYDRLYATNKRDPNILMGRAVVLQKLGRDDEAVEAYDHFLSLRPDNVEAQVNMLGLMGQRYPAVALQRLQELSEKNPRNVGLIAQIAVVQAKMARFEDAIRYLGMAASMEPENANHIFNMAVIADRAGSKKEAIKYYEQALEVDTLYGAGKTIPRESVFQRLAQLR